MNIRSSAQTVMCGMFIEKQGNAVKLNVGERWNVVEGWNVGEQWNVVERWNVGELWNLGDVVM